MTTIAPGTRRIAVLGAPMDLGSSRRGVDMGPSAIRYSGLLDRLAAMGCEVYDHGNIVVELRELAALQDEKARYLPEILAACAEVAAQVRAAAEVGSLPVVLGGDHSVAIGTLAGLHAAFGPGGVIWVDAHGDVNRPETTPSGNVHGMPLAAALGACGFSLDGFDPPPWVDPARVAIVGARSLDEGEKDLIHELGISVLTMADIDRRGIAAVMRDAIELASGPGFVHLSFDADACDPEIAPGVGTPVRGGLSYREAHLAMELVAEAGVLSALEFVEVNPILDLANATGTLAVELIASALGARIL
jgi:arginase